MVDIISACFLMIAGISLILEYMIKGVTKTDILNDPEISRKSVHNTASSNQRVRTLKDQENYASHDTCKMYDSEEISNQTGLQRRRKGTQSITKNQKENVKVETVEHGSIHSSGERLSAAGSAAELSVVDGSINVLNLQTNPLDKNDNRKANMEAESVLPDGTESGVTKISIENGSLNTVNINNKDNINISALIINGVNFLTL